MTGKGSRLLITVLLVSLAVALVLRFTSQKVIEATRTFPVLGTFATVIITAEEESIPCMMQSADSLLQHMETQLGRFSSCGELYTLNLSGAIGTDTELGKLVSLSDSLVSATSGYFDPSLGRLSLLWGFPQATAVPDSAMILEALAFTGWSTQVHIGTDSITLERGTFMDFGAVAKGYAVDRTYQFIRDAGAVECLVEVGGEVRCGSSTGRVWHIGVRHPREGVLAGTVSFSDGAVATSGDYECFFLQDGVRYSHLLDGTTGYPSWKTAGVTVLAADCATADAMATAAAVAGPQEAGNFSRECYTGMIIITEDPEGYCEIHTLGEVPWGP